MSKLPKSGSTRAERLGWAWLGYQLVSWAQSYHADCWHWPWALDGEERLMKEANGPFSNLDGGTAVSVSANCEETSPTSGRASEVTVVPLSGSLLTDIERDLG